MRDGIIQEAERDEETMKKRKTGNESLDAKYYDEHGVLGEIIDEPVEMSLETELRKALLSGKRPSRSPRAEIGVTSWV